MISSQNIFLRLGVGCIFVQCVLSQMCQPAKLSKGKKFQGFESKKKMKKSGWEVPQESEIAWQITSGKTKSPMTGPDAAYEGEHYIYMEASYPSHAGDEATLNFEPFEGCVCLKFMCHLWVNKHSKLEVRVNGKLYKVMRDSGLGQGRPWIQESITINEPGVTNLQLVGTRGDDFRGDIAIDDLSVTPGSCENDFDFEELMISRTLTTTDVDDDAESSGESSGDSMLIF